MLDPANTSLEERRRAKARSYMQSGFSAGLVPSPAPAFDAVGLGPQRSIIIIGADLEAADLFGPDDGPTQRFRGVAKFFRRVFSKSQR